MKHGNVALLGLLLLSPAGLAAAQERKPPNTKPVVPVAKSSRTAPAKQEKKDIASQVTPLDAKPTLSVEGLMKQGKTHYRAARFPQALTKFEAALKLEPERDETVALAAETAYRLNDQPKSRTLFLRRAELPNQKDSIKAFSFYRAALSYWREAHGKVAKCGTLKDGRMTFKLDARTAADADEQITNGLYYAERALGLATHFAEAHNVKNLLNAEAALVAADESKAAEHREAAQRALRRALEMKSGKPGEHGFEVPTVRLAEFTPTSAEAAKLDDPMLKLIEGGQPVKRVAAAFPSVRPPRQETDNASGVTADGGAYSLGSGRGALTAAYAPGKVKVEVLVSTAGEVVFVHVVQGRSDLNGAAVMAARKWKFAPATFEGKPVQVSGVITFDMKPGRRSPASATTAKQ